MYWVVGTAPVTAFASFFLIKYSTLTNNDNENMELSDSLTCSYLQCLVPGLFIQPDHLKDLKMVNKIYSLHLGNYGEKPFLKKRI